MQTEKGPLTNFKTKTPKSEEDQGPAVQRTHTGHAATLNGRTAILGSWAIAGCCRGLDMRIGFRVNGLD